MLPLILDPTARNVFRINTLRAACCWLCFKMEKELRIYYANKLSNKFIPDKSRYCENGLLVVPENGNSLNKGISFSLRKQICKRFLLQLSLSSIDHSYLKVSKTNDFPNDDLSFCCCKRKAGTYKETASESILSLLSTTVAANQIK